MPHLLRHRTSDFKVISERPAILSSECRVLCEEAITTYSTASNGTYGVSVMLRTGCRFFSASEPREVTSFPVLVKNIHCLVKSITARKADIIKVFCTTDKVAVCRTVFANTSTQYQNLSQKTETSPNFRRKFTIQSL